jgi:hypothetical protein
LNELLAATVHFWKATSIGFELPQQELWWFRKSSRDNPARALTIS